MHVRRIVAWLLVGLAFFGVSIAEAARWERAPRVLIYTPGGVSAPAQDAALALGYDVLRAETTGAFQQAFETGGPWDLIVLDHADQVTVFPETLADAVYVQATSGRAAITTFSAWERVDRGARDRAGVGAVQFLRILDPEIQRGGAAWTPHEFAEELSWPSARTGDFVTISRDAPASDVFLRLRGARITEDDAPTLGAVSFTALEGLAIHNVLRRASFGPDEHDADARWRDLYRAQMRWLLGDAYLLDAATAALLDDEDTLGGHAVHRLDAPDALQALSLQSQRARGIGLSLEESVTAGVGSSLRAAVRAGVPVVVSAPAPVLEDLAMGLADSALVVRAVESGGALEPAASGASRRFFLLPQLLLGATFAPGTGAAFDEVPEGWTALATMGGDPVALRWNAGSLVLMGAPIGTAEPPWQQSVVENLLANTTPGDAPVLVLSEDGRNLEGLRDALEERERELLTFHDVPSWLAAALLEDAPWLIVVTEDADTLAALDEDADLLDGLLDEGARLNVWTSAVTSLPWLQTAGSLEEGEGEVGRVVHLDARWRSLLPSPWGSPPRPSGSAARWGGASQIVDAVPWLQSRTGVLVAWTERNRELALAGWNPDLGRSTGGAPWIEALLDMVEPSPLLHVVGGDEAAWEVARDAAGLAGVRARWLTRTADISAALLSSVPLLLAVDPEDDEGALLWSVVDQRASLRLRTFVWTATVGDVADLGTSIGLGLSTQSLQRLVVPRASPQTTPLGFEAPWALSSPLDVPSVTAVVASAGQVLHAANTDLGTLVGGLRDDGRVGFWGVPRTAMGGPEAKQAFANLLVATLRVPQARIAAPSTWPEGIDLVVSAEELVDRFDEELTLRWRLADGTPLDQGSDLLLDGSTLEGPDEVALVLEVANASGLRFETSARILIENVAPVVTLEAPSVVEQGDDLEVTIYVEDVPRDLDAMIVRIDFGDGTQVTATPGDTPGVWTATHTYTALGTWAVTATAEDLEGAIGTDAIDVEMKNVPPIVEVSTPGPLLEGATGRYSAVATDPGGGSVTLTWTFGPAPGTKRTGAEVEHAFGQSGVFLVELLAEDEDGGETSVQVQQPVINVPPRFTSEPPASVLEGETFAYDASFVDPGFDNVHTFELLAGPSGMVVSSSGEVRWTANVLNYLPVPVTLRVRDQAGGQDTQAWMLEVRGVDSSGGGAPDACKVRWGLDPTDPSDESSDLTGDGLTVAEACRYGRSPVDFSGPSAPTLIRPVDGETWFREEILFTWDNAEPWPQGESVAPITYDLELYGSEDATSPLLRWEDLPEEASRTRLLLDPAPALGEDLTLWWRVRARDPIARGAWSPREPFLLNRDNRAPGRPAIVAPRRAASANPPLLRWAPTTDPDGDRLTYEVEVGPRVAVIEVEEDDEVDTPISPLDRVFHIPRLEPEGDGVIEIEMPEPLDPEREYFFRVRAWDHLQPGPFDVASFRVELDNQAPPVPTIVGPADQRPWLTAESVSLVWTAVVDPDGDPVTYDLQIARDASFAEPLVDVRRLTLGDREEGEFGLPDDLGTGRFHWRVRASDGLAESAWAASTFRRADRNTPPSAPELRVPLQDEELVVGPVELRIRNATSLEDRLRTYQFQIAEDAAFRRLVVSMTDVPEGAEETATPVDDLSAGTYVWRARAHDGLDVGPWSSTRRFHLRSEADVAPEDPSDPEIPVPESPEPDDERRRSGGCAVAAGAERGPTHGLWMGWVLLGLVVRRRRSGGSS